MTFAALALAAACGGTEAAVSSDAGGAADAAPDATTPASGDDAAGTGDGARGDAGDAGVQAGPLVLAVIGDYGVCAATDPAQYSVTCPDEQRVAALVHAWAPRAIVTTGDDSYGSGRADQIPGDQAPYDDYIDAGRFFPAMGNHDWLDSQGIAPSLAYFGLASPYYTHAFDGLVTFYVLDTDDHDDAGVTATSAQATWLRAQLAASTTPWNVVVNHEAPYSSCGEFSYDGTGGREDFRWIAAAGADVVLSGHSHVYERLLERNAVDAGPIPYVVIGASGAPLQGDCGVARAGQQKAIYGSFGALRLAVTAKSLAIEFAVEDGGVRDALTLTK